MRTALRTMPLKLRHDREVTGAKNPNLELSLALFVPNESTSAHRTPAYSLYFVLVQQQNYGEYGYEWLATDIGGKPKPRKANAETILEATRARWKID